MQHTKNWSRHVSHSVLSRCRVLLAMTLAAVLALNMLPAVLAESPPNTAIVPVPKLENLTAGKARRSGLLP